MTDWTPPTQCPEAGQGPWCDVGGQCWWVVAERAGDALNIIESLSTETFPIYFGWHAVAERVCIRWVEPEEWNEEHEIEECKSDYPWHAEAWRVKVVG